MCKFVYYTNNNAESRFDRGIVQKKNNKKLRKKRVEEITIKNAEFEKIGNVGYSQSINRDKIMATITRIHVEEFRDLKNANQGLFDKELLFL